MAGNTKISLRIRGPDNDDGHVRFDDFISQLASIRKALVVTDHTVSDKASTYFRVVDLQHNSPALVVLEAVPIRPALDNSEKVVGRFFRSLGDIERGVAPDGFGFSDFQAFKEVTNLLDKDRITELVISRDSEQTKRLTSLSPQIEKILGPDEYEIGSVTGMLEQINVHANQNVFTIYPTSKRRKLRCIFPSHLRPQATQAVDQYVRVYGRMKYKSHLEEKEPYEMIVKDLEVHIPEAELPTLGSLRGIASGTGEGTPSEDLVQRVRHEW